MFEWHVSQVGRQDLALKIRWGFSQWSMLLRASEDSVFLIL